jgi:hypothetical protein
MARRWINFRREMKGLIGGDPMGIAQGQWVVIRIMRIGELSKFWHEDRKEAIGGPKWNYDDHIVRAITMPGASILTMPKLRSAEATIVQAGLDDVNAKLFGIGYSRDFREPATSDLIYTINKYERAKRPIPPFRATGRYNITGTLPAHGDHGRIEIYLLVATRAHGEE